MKKFLLVLLTALVMGCGAFVDEETPISALEAAGYSEASCPDSHIFPNPKWWGCSEEDDVAFKCTATNPSGVRVSLTVCSSYMFKGSTIRHN